MSATSGVNANVQPPSPRHSAVVGTPSQLPPGTEQHPGFDLAGWATLILALVATWQVLVSRAAIEQTRLEAERGFAFEAIHQAQLVTPIVIAEASAKRPGQFRYLTLSNVGQGPAINVRFSGNTWTGEFSAAQHSVAALGSGGISQTNVQLHKDYEKRDPICQLLIRYEDIFGNNYSTEYVTFQEDSEWYVWRRPWLGKRLNLPRPPMCSEDETSWGFHDRQYYDAEKGLY